MYKFKYQHGARAKALSSIYEDLLELGVNEVRRYRDEFKREKDYNIAQYGNLLVYYSQVRYFLIDCGFTQYGEKFKQKAKCNYYKISDDTMWDYYKGLVRVAVNTMLDSPEDIVLVWN